MRREKSKHGSSPRLPVHGPPARCSSAELGGDGNDNGSDATSTGQTFTESFLGARSSRDDTRTLFLSFFLHSGEVV